MKKIAVVTVNYNTQKDTIALLQSLKRADCSEYQMNIIIIDNGSKEKFSLINNIDTKNITIIQSDVNTGFTGGYNIGLKRALEQDVDYILIINNDTEVAPDMIKNLAKALEKHDNAGVTAPKIYFAKGHEYHKSKYSHNDLGKVLWYAGGQIDWSNVTSIHRGVDQVDHGQYDNEETVTFASGCCMMFKREVLENVGLFDERFFLYFEDADLNERIKHAGYDIYYVPSAVLLHLNASSSGGAGNSLQDYYITRNQMLFGMKYAPLRSRIALLRQSFRLLYNGRKNQKKAIRDFYTRKFGKGNF